MTETSLFAANIEHPGIKPYIAGLANAAVMAMVELEVGRASIPRLVALAHDGEPTRLPRSDFEEFKQALATDPRLVRRSRGQFALNAALKKAQREERQERSDDDHRERGLSNSELTKRLAAIANDADVKRMRREAARRHGAGRRSGKGKSSKGEGRVFFGNTASRPKKKHQGKKLH